jgi:hypothetical protein
MRVEEQAAPIDGAATDDARSSKAAAGKEI